MTQKKLNELKRDSTELTIQELDEENLCDKCGQELSDGEAIYELDDGDYACQSCYENEGERLVRWKEIGLENGWDFKSHKKQKSSSYSLPKGK